MIDFKFTQATDCKNALDTIRANSNARFIAGGTNLIDLMKSDVMKPDALIDINRALSNKIEKLDNGGLRLGATATNATTAHHPLVIERYPLLSSAILHGASPQLRNMATNAGNLMQRTRCYYFYDNAAACNKRQPGSGCAAIQGVNRIHAILGTSDKCIAVHPSDMCVALAALDATVQVRSSRGERAIAFHDFHRLPGEFPELDNVLENDEIIVSIDLPQEGFATNYSYIKARERNSYAFALTSAAVAFKIENEKIVQARMALGGVAAKPWRNSEAENFLVGKSVNETDFAKAADLLLQEAKGFGKNDFKIKLARQVVIGAMNEAAQKNATGVSK